MAFLLAFLPFSACDQGLNGTGDEPRVLYDITVLDSLTGLPVPGVRVQLFGSAGDSVSAFTDSLEGRTGVLEIYSSETSIHLSRSGYRGQRFLDTIAAESDSLPVLPRRRSLIVRLLKVAGEGPRVQIRIQVLREGERIPKARITYFDSSDNSRTVTGDAQRTALDLQGLRPGPQNVKLEAEGHLGRRVTVQIPERPDSLGRPPVSAFELPLLDATLSGQVAYKGPRGSVALPKARVEFRLLDSGWIPAVFSTLTAAESGSEGRFRFPALPRLNGELRFYKDENSREALWTRKVSAEEVGLDGDLPPVLLTLPADSGGPPRLIALPADTLGHRDSLLFRLTVPVTRFTCRVFQLSVPGAPREVLVRALADSGNRRFRMAAAGESWIPGSYYRYEVSGEDAGGIPLTGPGGAAGIQGFFQVRDTLAPDTALSWPVKPVFTLFSSGSSPFFRAGDSTASPALDSTSNFARLRWSSSQGGRDSARGRPVDSVTFWVKSDAPGDGEWSRLLSLPGFVDSATLDFSRLYATMAFPEGPGGGASRRFPVREGGTISVLLLPKQAGMLREDKAPAPLLLSQGMGPSVYAVFDSLPPGSFPIDTTLSLGVRFLKAPGRLDSPASLDTSSRQKPLLLKNGVPDSSSLSFRWTGPGTGVLLARLLRADADRVEGVELSLSLTGYPQPGSGGGPSRPLWQRNKPVKRITLR